MLIEYRSQIPYNNAQDCKINFVCPTDQVVVVDVKLFDIEYHSSCDYDYLSFDGEKKCGSTHPVISTSNNEIEISFHSSYTDTADGFKLHLGCKGTFSLTKNFVKINHENKSFKKHDMYLVTFD